jgi:hypothetical protein
MKFIQLVTAMALSTAFGLIASTSTSAIEIAQAQNIPGQTNPGQPESGQIRTGQPRSRQNTPAQPANPVVLPRLSHRLVWQKSQTLREDAGWVESAFDVNKEGKRLILGIQGNLELQSARVQFDNGEVQSIPVQSSYVSGESLLLDFGGTRRVQSIQIVGRTSSSRKAAFSVQLIT